MKILITSDLQFSANSRDEYRFRIGPQITQLIRKEKIDWLYLLGDLTEAKDEHPATLVNQVSDMIFEWSRICQVLVLQGNHEYTDIAHPFFRFIRHFDGVRWISKPTNFHGALFLPHTRDHERDWKDLELGGKIFAHNIFEGCKAGNGTVLKGIPLELFKRNTKIISGDVHEPQTFFFVTYVGSPYLCDFGDSYDPRVLCLDGDKTKSIPIDGPQKRLIECKAGKGLLTNWDAYPGDIIKVRIHLEPRHTEKWDEIRKAISEWAEKHDYTLNSIEPIVNYLPQEKRSGPRFGHKSDAEYMNEYAARRGLDTIMLKEGLTYIED